MTFQEKRSILSSLSSILILGLYSLFVYTKYISVNPNIVNDFKFWGKAFLILIPVSIAVQIIIHIIFAIINKITTNEDFPNISDERDKLIQLKAVRISHWVFIAGFFISMGSLALGLKPFIMFIILTASGFIAAIADDIAKFFLYRRGF